MLILRISLACLAAAAALSAQPVVTRYAGRDWLFNFEGKAATAAPFSKQIRRAAVDAQGNFYLADPYNYQVFRIDRTGRITVVAGTGISAYSGDGGPATSASLSFPIAVEVGPDGTLYIADNVWVRRVSPQGIITTIAGAAQGGFAGDGGPARQARFSNISGLALDSAGNLYVCDRFNDRIRMVTPDGIIRTVAGNGQRNSAGDGGPATQAGLQEPFDIAVDAAGNLYIAQTTASRIRRVARDLTISTVTGDGTNGFTGDDGPANRARVSVPSGIAVNAAGVLYIADLGNRRIRTVGVDGVIRTVAGNGQTLTSGDGGAPLNASFVFPHDIAVRPDGSVVVVDQGAGLLREFTPGRTIATTGGNGNFRRSPDQATINDLFLFRPQHLAFDQSGGLVIADTQNAFVWRITSDGAVRRLAGIGVNGNGADGPATEVLAVPQGVTISPQGEVVIADGSNQVRRIRADGRIERIAGQINVFDSRGDNGPATSAGINSPSGVAYDAAGNLYIAEFNGHRVRRVTPPGVISTLAGNGEARSAGDGGPASAASVFAPRAVAVDTAGNVYIGEFNGCRIRRVSPAGVITTFAGNGTCGFSGDGGPAAQGRVGAVSSLIFDTAGNLFFTEVSTDRIRRVSRDGILSTVAGNGRRGFTGDGGPALEASFNAPFGLAFDRNGNLYVSDSNNDRVRVLPVGATSFSATPTSFAFTSAAGGERSQPQFLLLRGLFANSPIEGVPYTLTLPAWLEADSVTGVMPARVALRLNPSQQSAGALTGSVRVTVPGALPGSLDIPVTANLTERQPGRLGVDSATLTFGALQGTPQLRRRLVALNTGSGRLDLNLRLSGGPFSLVANRGSATPSDPAEFLVDANTETLAPGTYRSNLTVEASNGESRNIALNLTVSPAQPSLLLSQTGLSFQVTAGGGKPLSRFVSILNSGAGALNWSATARMFSGSGWLRAGLASGLITEPLSAGSRLPVEVDTAGLAPGTYYGDVRIEAPGAVNSPQTVGVVLTVLETGGNPGVEVEPQALVFVAPAGSTPAAQSLQINYPANSGISYSGAVLYFAGPDNYLTSAPLQGALDPAEAARIVVQPDFADLTPGVARAMLLLSFGDGTSRVIPVVTIATPPGAADAKSQVREAFGGCAQTGLRIESPTLTQPNFTARIGQPQRVEVRVFDACGNPLVRDRNLSPVVQAGFSNRDPRLDLQHTSDGLWTATWTPQNGSGAVTLDITALATSGSRFYQGQVSYSGTLQAAAGAPRIASGAVVNAASGEAAVVSPGGYISLYGVELGEGAVAAQSIPLPVSIGSTQVILSGRALPLSFAGPGQVNALVPYDLSVNTQHQVSVRRGSTSSSLEAVTVAPAQPAIYTLNQTGRGAGVIVDGLTNAVITPQRPARRGDVLVIYANGLGAVSPPVALGAAAPLAGPLSRVVAPVSVRIGGVDTRVDFAGLAPGFPGLYQLNVVVPAAAPAGDEVPVTIETNGQTSPAVTLAIR